MYGKVFFWGWVGGGGGGGGRGVEIGCSYHSCYSILLIVLLPSAFAVSVCLHTTGGSVRPCKLTDGSGFFNLHAQ